MEMFIQLLLRVPNAPFAKLLSEAIGENNLIRILLRLTKALR